MCLVAAEPAERGGGSGSNPKGSCGARREREKRRETGLPVFLQEWIEEGRELSKPPLLGTQLPASQHLRLVAGVITYSWAPLASRLLHSRLARPSTQLRPAQERFAALTLPLSPPRPADVLLGEKSRHSQE